MLRQILVAKGTVWFRQQTIIFIALIFNLICLPNIATASEEPDTETITIQLRWHHQFQFAGYYAALEKGYYRDEGLSVRINAGDPDHQPVSEVLSGKAQYAEGNSEVLFERLQGEPLVALAAIFQHSPSVLLTLESSGIRSVHDLIGKRVVFANKDEDADFLTMFLNEGIDSSDLSVIPSSYQLSDLIEGNVDAFNSYTTNEPFVLSELGLGYNIIDPINYRVDFYSDIFFTTEQELRDNPKRVDAMLRATLKGWRYAMDNPQEIIDLLIEKYKVEKSREHLQFEAREMRKLILPDLIKIGHMNPERWQHMADTFIKAGQVKNANHLKGFIYDPNPEDVPDWVFPVLIVTIIIALLATSITLYLHRINRRLAITQKQLLTSEGQLKLAASVFTHAREGIMITDRSGKIIDVNDTFSLITGYERNLVLGQNPRILKSHIHNSDFYKEMWSSLLNRKQWTGEVWNKRHDGALYAEMLTISAVSDSEGTIQNFVALFSDITQKKRHQQQLEHIAHFDTLTNLPNRILLADRLRHAINQCDRRSNSLAVAYLDLDGFKAINDAYGHSIGDQLLIELSKLMNQTLRDGDTLARIGGDEFVAIFADINHMSDCEQILERILQAALSQVTIDDKLLQVSASIGVTLYPQDGVEGDQLIRHADQAMYIAKQTGKNRYHLFDVNKDRSIQNQRETIEHIMRGITQQEFKLHYQPKVNMRTGDVVGAEALIRWHTDEKGILSPIDFLPVIENHPISRDLGLWVIKTALKQIQNWQSGGLSIPVSVNVDAIQLQDPDFVRKLSLALADYPSVTPEMLQLEILETSALGDITEVLSTMNACIDLGVGFALDDFGTGFSSLTYLKRLPVDLLKIDQSFVRDMLDDPDDRAIVQGVISLASAFNRQVIAGGVETIDHGKQLLSMGCELAQGYGIAKPIEAERFSNWVRHWRPDETWINTQPEAVHS